MNARLLAGLGLFGVALGAGLIALIEARRRDALDRRLAMLRPASAPAPRRLAVDVVTGLGAAFARSGLLSARTRQELEATLANAGLRGGKGLGLFLGSKVLLMAALPVLAATGLPHGVLHGTARFALVGLAGLGGMLGPDMFVRHRRQRVLRGIERGLPEALDLMVICAQAGLGLEAALERVGEEVRFANPHVANEFRITSAEMRVGGDRRAVLMAMGERTGLEPLKRLAATLVQTMQYGTPLSQALRVLSAELRTDMLTKFEERAARLPVLLTMPMILFILPCVFVVVGGPAGLRIARMFAHH